MRGVLLCTPYIQELAGEDECTTEEKEGNGGKRRFHFGKN